jgi:hypothetical protein
VKAAFSSIKVASEIIIPSIATSKKVSSSTFFLSANWPWNILFQSRSSKIRETLEKMAYIFKWQRSYQKLKLR